MHYVAITGGVISGLGKGTITSSLSHILSNSGHKVSAMKIDPYLNFDAGTMNPYQHGEVFVLNDGGEVDLDLGNYERFLNRNLLKENNITTGKIYSRVIEKEREGKYLGETVQIIPHITNEIKSRIRKVADSEKCDVLLIEVGGTVGDIESMPFLEALRELNREEPKNSLLFCHVTLIPEIGGNMEQKTKPTQHSVNELRGIGIQPDIIFCRLKGRLSEESRKKISTFTDVPEEGIIGVPDAHNIYYIPEIMYSQGILQYIEKYFSLKPGEFRDPWVEYKRNLESAKEKVKIAVVGKYTKFMDAYISHKEAFTHVTGTTGIGVDIAWLDSDEVKKNPSILSEADGILVPGGFGYRGVEGKVKAVQYARENNVPFLGICLGFQAAVIEYARNVLGIKDANSSEFDQSTSDPVIDLLPEQIGVSDLGGTMRLGGQKVHIESGTIASSLYNTNEISERHRHRYEVNPKYIDRLEEKGMIFSGKDDAGIRMEIAEIRGKNNFIATQYHSEFQSRPLNPSRVHKYLVQRALEFKRGRKV